MSTERTLVFAGENETEAKQLVATLRARDIGGTLRSAFYFDGVEPCGKIIIMPDVPGFHADKIREAFPGKYDAPVSAPAAAVTTYVTDVIDAKLRATTGEVEYVCDIPGMTAKRRRGRPRKHPQI